MRSIVSKNFTSNVAVLSSRTVADHVLFLRSELDLETTTMQIIKLVYICHGWMLGIYDRKLMSEPVEAWKYGPVVPNVYRTFKLFRGNPIDTVPIDQSGDLDSEQSALIREVVRAYRDYDGLQLSTITHMKGTPWHTVYRNGRGLGSIIPDKLIKEYYVKRVVNE